MSQSPEINKLAEALAAAQSSLNGAKLDLVNPHFRSQYASLQSVWNAAREVLAPNGLSVVQTFGQTDGARLDLTTTLMHVSGQWIAGTISLTPTKADPQGCGSAATYARRYSLAAILGIVADEDDDGEAATRPHAETHARPVSRPVAASPAKPAAPSERLDGDPADWRDCPVPAFTKNKAATVGEMSDKDRQWWAANYTVKPFKGQINPADQDFRDALSASMLEFP